MPPDGATHSGTSLGIHFFHGDQVMEAAMKRGHLNTNIDNDDVENEWNDEQQENSNREQFSTALMDDSSLVGSSKIITLETARLSAELMVAFSKENQESVSFQAVFFNPLWQRLKVQGTDLNLNWKYDKCTGTNSLSRNWCYVPPSSDLGAKGKSGVDFFVREEEVVLQVLQAAQKVPSLAPLFTKIHSYTLSFMTTLTRAVQENMVSLNCSFNVTSGILQKSQQPSYCS